MSEKSFYIDVNMRLNRLFNLPEPTSDTEAATKSYVDSLVVGGGVTDGNKGDISVSLLGSSWTINNGAVTDAKISDVAWTKISSTPTTLAGYGIIDAQAKDDDLTAIAGIAATSGLLRKTAANTWSLDTSTYLTSYTETDPIYTASSWATTINNASNWDTAYSWGNHTLAGYLTIESITDTLVTGKVLTGLSITGSTIAATDTILQAFGKLQNQLNGVLGGAIYQGVWNANTNSPSLTSGVGTKGYYYVVSVDGTTTIDGYTNWKVGDWIIFNGTTWDKVDNTDAVSSVNGNIGAITLSGTTDRITVSGTTWDIASTYVGQTSITTLGTIGTGVWQGTKIAHAYLEPAGNSSNIQFNNSGSFAGSDDLTWDNVNSRLGIGTMSPYATLTVVSQGTGNVRAIVGEHYDNTTAFSHFKVIGGRARGSKGSPNAVLTDDSLVSFNGRGYKTTTWSNTVGGFYVYASENWTDSATGTYMTFRGVPAGTTTAAEWARISSTGLGVGITPTARLHAAAGTTTIAPLKLTSGTALTTPEDGSLEYHSSHLYFTIGSTRYQLDQQSGGSTLPSYATNALKFLRVNAGETDVEWATVSASPGGSDTHIQFNDGGVFGGVADFTFNKTTKVASLAGTAAFVNVSQTGSNAVGYKIGSQWVARFDTTLNNFTFGNNSTSYSSITTATGNFFAGNYFIGTGMTSAAHNIAIGFDSSNNEPLRNLTTGRSNIAFGRGAARGNTTGNYNIAIGEFSLYTNSIGSDNIALGYGALNKYTRYGTIAFGQYAFENLIGTGGEDDNLIGIGYHVGRYVVNGRHILIGTQAGRDMSNASSDYALAIGHSAGYGLRFSLYDVAIGHTSMGYFNGLQTTLANVAVGYGAMQLATWSRYMVAIGYQAGYQNNTATAQGQNDGSVYIGYQAGYSTLGNRNVFIGHQAGYSETTVSNKFILANGSATTNQLLLGNFDNTNRFLQVVGRLNVGDNSATANAGDIRYNTSTNKHEGYNGSTWNAFY